MSRADACPWGSCHAAPARPVGSFILGAAVLVLCGFLAAGAESVHQDTPPTLHSTAQVTSAAQTVPVPAPAVVRR